MEKKQEKKSEGMEIEGIDVEHIGKEKSFQKVTFDFHEPDQKYYHNLMVLLKKTFCFVTWSPDMVVNKICAQKEFGIILGIADDKMEVEEEEDETIKKDISEDNSVYALLTVLKMTELIEQDFLAKLQNFILSNSSEDQKKFLIENIFQELEYSGIMINERVINLPIMVVPLLYQQLLEDKYFIDKSKEYSEKEKASYSFKYIIYFTTAAYRTKEVPEKIKFSQLLFGKVEDNNFLKRSICTIKLENKNRADYILLMMVLKYDDFIDLSSDSKNLQ